MIAFSYYLLKVLICSAILYGYYLLALKNKIFHSWNRFYLLAIVILSFASPLIRIGVWQKSQALAPPVIKLLQVVNTGDEYISDYSAVNRGIHMDASNISLLIYSLVSGLLIVLLIKTLVRIDRLKHSYPSTLIEGINFRNTNAKGTPFSFFNNIFWNNKIDLHTPAGKQIFRHEVAHITERHSYDKIFMNIVLILFWCNPIFWLIRKELNLIHEFIADKKAIENNDTTAFAAMILQATYPHQLSFITNSFFYSPIKRRLQMLTKNRNPKINYLSRLLVLPLAVLVFFAFTLKSKKHKNYFYTGKKITVVIDAGHGGDDKGVSVEGISEKDITLSLATQIRDLNTNKNINIVLTRSDDSSFGVKKRVDFARSVNADLYISIHINGDAPGVQNSGFSVLIPQNDNAYIDKSKLLGSNLIESFKNYSLPVNNKLKQSEKGVWILKANQYPVVLIEAGVLTTQKDLEYLIKPRNQKIIAQNILDGIEKYALQNLFSKSNREISGLNDTRPGSSSQVLVRLQSNGAITDEVNKSTLTSDTIIVHTPVTTANSHTPGKAKRITMKNSDTAKVPLYIVDEKEISKNELNQIPANKIQSINVLKGESAIKKYGDKGKNGVIEITMKQTPITLNLPNSSSNENVKVKIDDQKHNALIIIDSKQASYGEINN